MLSIMREKATPPHSSTTDQPPSFVRPLTTVDVVIFTIRDGALSVLLVRRHEDPSDPFPGYWALPGGFIDTLQDPDLESCARRKLLEKTGVSAPYLEQLGSWGDAKRDPRGWSSTHVFFALISASQVELTAGGNTADSRWIAVSGDRVSPQLAFDHSDLLAAAVRRLRAKVEYTALPAYLMPGEFTLTELQRAYEVVLDRTLEKKAFRTRFLSSGVLSAVHRMKGGSNRPARLFRLRRRLPLHFFSRPFGSAAVAGTRAS
jgi:ADP-ribose pyrophosphatase YjhB (NUDIX family)